MTRRVFSSPFVLVVLAVLCYSAVPTQAQTLITFDDIPVGSIGTQYLSRGVMFYEGNDQRGNSTDIRVVNNQLVTAYAGNFGTGVSQPNVMVPNPGSNNDIIVHFFDSLGQRTFVESAGVTNDAEGNPSAILEAFDINGTSLGKTAPLSTGIGGTVTAPNNIYYVKIYGDPNAGGALGVDNFSFQPVPAPSALAAFVIGAAPGAAVLLRRRRK